MASWSDRVHVVEYDSAVALRYHGRRQAFLDFLARLDPALSVIFGGAAFASIVAGSRWWAGAAALMVAITSALNLAFGLTDRARLHGSLFRKWGELRADLATLAEDDDAALRLLEARREKIDAESPWQLLALSALCENEEKKVRREGSLCRIGWLQRALANWCTLPGWHPELPSI